MSPTAPKSPEKQVEKQVEKETPFRGRRIPAWILAAALAPFSGSPTVAAGPPRLEDYLPGGHTYDESIPKPESILGWQIGEWHVRHDQLARYFEVLAASSDRALLQVQGLTHERREQLLLVISTAENLGRLEEIRESRRALTDPELPMPSDEELESMPAVVLLGYSIHGNEASGSNASLAVAYHLAAARGSEIDALLDKTVVLIDPSLNPDGLGRFAHWANMHRGQRAVGDPDHREHREVWPGGRTNHYWFDLNRDWLLLQHPESRNRIETFHRWKPNLLGDYHEMGSDATYFFQPGVPSRQNPLTPPENLELTREIATFHAEILDRERRYYYTEETFDDFYPGKGSTYPDLNGSVGVLFEQASARGRLQDTANGPLSFPFAIRNQALTSYSMLQAARERRLDLLRYQGRFFRRALELAKSDDVRGYVFSVPGDPARAWHLLDLLRRHQIRVHALEQPLEAAGHTFEPASSWIVAVDQPQYRLAKALFERQTSFADPVFYDVSTWTLPLAYGAVSAELSAKELSADLFGEAVEAAALPAGHLEESSDAVAYLLDWRGYYAPRALYRLQEAGFRVRVTTRPFEAEVGTGLRRFDYGTLIVPVGLPRDRQGLGGPGELPALEEVLRTISREDGVDVYATTSGLTPSGGDLGSPNARPLERPRPLLVVGDGVASYEAGEVWHLLDHRFGIEVSLVDVRRLGRLDLGDYTHILMVQGSYTALQGGSSGGRAATGGGSAGGASKGDHFLGNLRRWIRGGGSLIASKSAARWVEQQLYPPDGKGSGARGPSKVAGEDGAKSAAIGSPAATGSPAAPAARIPFANYERKRAEQLISGTIFEVELDLTHPLAFGYRDPKLAVFRNSTLRLEPSSNPFENVALYGEAKRLSGYVSEQNLEKLSGAAAVRARREGEGTVILLSENPNFRGFWLGTNKLYLNALFFSSAIRETQAPSKWR